jgi:hypothetical protein
MIYLASITFRDEKEPPYGLREASLFIRETCKGIYTSVAMIITIAQILPKIVLGLMSPYPTVATYIMAY